MTERCVERWLVRAAEECGGAAVKLTAEYSSGMPDRLVLLPGGRMFFAELKAQGKKPRKLQDYWHKRLRRLGFTVYVIDSVQGALAAVAVECGKDKGLNGV